MDHTILPNHYIIILVDHTTLQEGHQMTVQKSYTIPQKHCITVQPYHMILHVVICLKVHNMIQHQITGGQVIQALLEGQNVAIVIKIPQEILYQRGGDHHMLHDNI